MIWQVVEGSDQTLQLRQKRRAANRRRKATATTTGRFPMGRTSLDRVAPPGDDPLKVLCAAPIGKVMASA
jgi:hypothetical protein